MSDFLIANHCRNIKRLARIGFEFSDVSVFSMNGTMVKRKKSFYLHLFPIDGIALLNDDTSDVNNPNFLSDTCETWNELLDALVRRKAITEKAAAKLKEAQNDNQI